MECGLVKAVMGPVRSSCDHFGPDKTSKVRWRFKYCRQLPFVKGVAENSF